MSRIWTYWAYYQRNRLQTRTASGYTISVMQATAQPQQRATASEFFAFERAIESTSKHRAQNRLVPFIAQWDTLLTLFRHTVEIPFLVEVEWALTPDQHRVVLTNLLAMAEMIWNQVKDLENPALAAVGYDKAFVEENLNISEINMKRGMPRMMKESGRKRMKR